jgi:hypothetical protein
MGRRSNPARETLGAHWPGEGDWKLAPDIWNDGK